MSNINLTITPLDIEDLTPGGVFDIVCEFLYALIEHPDQVYQGFRFGNP